MKNLKMILSENELKTIKDLKKQIKKTSGRCVLASIEHVSSSGMSRIINYGFINKKGGFYYLSYLIGKISGYSRPQNYSGVKVGGCGMDMIFAVLSHFYKDIGIKDDYPQYSSSYTRF